MKIQNITPNYMAVKGGFHYVVEMDNPFLTVHLSAIKADKDSEWLILRGDEKIILPASEWASIVWTKLCTMTKEILSAALAEIE